jgi:hypothetical protein
MPKQPCPAGQTWSEKLQKCVTVSMSPSKLEVPGSLDTTNTRSAYENYAKKARIKEPTPKKKIGGAKTKAYGSMMKKGGAVKRKK